MVPKWISYGLISYRAMHILDNRIIQIPKTRGFLFFCDTTEDVSMGTKINHVAIVSDNFAVVGKFYEALFGFKSPTTRKLFNAVTVGDGYVGININPRRPGRPAGLDHF